MNILGKTKERVNFSRRRVTQYVFETEGTKVCGKVTYSVCGFQTSVQARSIYSVTNKFITKVRTKVNAQRSTSYMEKCVVAVCGFPMQQRKQVKLTFAYVTSTCCRQTL